METDRSDLGLVVFDGDDTLWESQELYDQSKLSIRDALENAGHSGEEWATLMEQIDVARVESLGWDPTRFPGSCVIAYQELASMAGSTADAELMSQIRKLAESVFTRRANVAAGAEMVLEHLRKRFRLALLTQGDREVQRRRIDESGLAPLFDTIDIVDRKGEQTFLDIVEQQHVNAAEAWSVGNSLRSDVYPALNAGLHAIWLRGSGWAYDAAHEAREVQNCPTAGSLSEVEAILLGATVATPAGHTRGLRERA